MHKEMSEMRKLLLLAPSPHSLEYSKKIVSAAKGSGIDAQVFIAKSGGDREAGCIPVFTCTDTCLPTGQKQSILGRDLFFASIAGGLCRLSQSLRRILQLAITPLIAGCMTSGITLVGAFFYWITPPFVTGVTRAFCHQIQESLLPRCLTWLPWLAAIHTIPLYYECKFACTEGRLDKNDVVFLPEITKENFLPLMLAAAWITRKREADVVIQFKNAVSMLLQNSTFLWARLLLEKLVLEGRCYPVTERIETAKEHAVHIAAPMQIIPGICSIVERKPSAEKHFNAMPNLLSVIMRCGKQSTRIDRPPSILVAYPRWNISGGTAGNGLRVKLLVRFLQEQGYPVELLLLRQPIDNQLVVYHYDEPFFFQLIRKIGTAFNLSDIELFFLVRRCVLFRNFRLKLTQALIGKDIILVDYQFYLLAITPLAKVANVPVISNVHDDHALQCKIPFVSRFIEKRQETLLTNCAGVTTIEMKEHQFFKRKGIDNILIPPAVDILNFQENIKNTTFDALQYAHVSGKHNLLFVGSRHFPNIKAKEYIFKLAAQALKRGFDWRFFVVGACGTSEECTDNVCVTGMVPSNELFGLYNVADVILIPLLTGTGASIKTVEGMAASRPVLGTSIAFRGLDVKDKHECFIEDDFDNYISMIDFILSNPEKAKSVALNGCRFAAKHDYRKVYAKYNNFITQLLHAEESHCNENSYC